MLKKNDTLILRKERLFFKSASRIQYKNFSLFWLSNESKLLQQVIIAKGVAKNSVQRNAIKRVFKKMLSEMKIAHPDIKKSVVVIIKNRNCLAELETIQTELELVLTQQ